MSAMVKPNIATYEADAAIAKGQAVKFGTSNKRMTPASATTDAVVGIAQNAAVNVGDLVEVALPGGGAKALAQASISKGNRLGVNASGSVQKVASQGDSEFAIAMDDASAGDIFEVFVKGNTSAYASQS